MVDSASVQQFGSRHGVSCTACRHADGKILSGFLLFSFLQTDAEKIDRKAEKELQAGLKPGTAVWHMVARSPTALNRWLIQCF